MKIRLLLLLLVLPAGIWALEIGSDHCPIRLGLLYEYPQIKGPHRDLFMPAEFTLAILVASLLCYLVYARQRQTLAELRITHAKMMFREEQLRKVIQRSQAVNAELTASHAALLESQLRYQKMAANIPGVIYQFVIRPDGTRAFPFVSEKCKDMIGVDAAAIQGDVGIVFGFVHPDDRASLHASIETSARQIIPWLWEGRFLVCGTCKWLRGAAKPEAQPDGSVLYDGLMIDVTERKHVEQALHKSKQMLQLVLDTIPSAVFWKDRDSIYVGCNRVFAQDAGLPTSAAIVHKTDFDLIWNAHAQLYRDDDRWVMETNTAKLGYEEPTIKAGHSLHWLRTSKAPLRDAEGNVIGVLGTYEDITERKVAEEKIKESEQRFRAIFDNAADGILLADPQTRRFYLANKAMCEMLGYTAAELATMEVADIHPAQDLPFVLEQFEKQARREIKTVDSIPVKRKDGSVFDADISVFFITLADKTYMAGLFRDITKRKQAENRMRASLREKEVLLKEIHHRVKNNLQIISSLLSLQSQHIADPRDLQLFQESQSRVRTMALIHEQLYQSRDLAQTHFAEYLRVLTGELLRAYKVQDVQVRVEVEEHIQLGIDLAIPCALIVHELVTNALKYAFVAPRGKKTRRGAVPPEIRVAFRDEPGAGFLLVVGDNGIGLPDSIGSGKSRSLGWRLITALVAQVHGCLEIDRQGGATVRIRLPQDKQMP